LINEANGEMTVRRTSNFNSLLAEGRRKKGAEKQEKTPFSIIFRPDFSASL